MTVKDFENKFNKLGIQLKRKTNIPEQYEITLNDINKADIYQKYKQSDNLLKIVDGFIVIDNDIAYCKTEIDSIDIETNNRFPPCGGKELVEVYANYIVKLISYNGINYAPIHVGRSKINALVTVDNNLFIYEKPFIVNERKNESNENIEVNIHASYYFRGRKYEASERVLQASVGVYQWKVKGEHTDEIKLLLSKNIISDKGGAISTSIVRLFSRTYTLEDSCGNIIGDKTETGLTNNITKDYVLTTSDNKLFSVDNNNIIFPKQKEGANERECTITAIFDGKTNSAIVKQLSGPNVKYTYELLFWPEMEKNKTILLDTYLPSNKKFFIYSRCNKFFDGIYKSSKVIGGFSINCNVNWINCDIYIEDDKKGLQVLDIDIIEPNTDTKNDRDGIITIINNEDINKNIMLVVKQPHMVVRNVFLKVYIESIKNMDEENILTTSGKLTIDDEHIIKLNPGWINVNMEEHKDIIYQGYIELNEGMHTFKTNGIEYNGKSYDVSEELFLDEKTNEIEINVKI